VTSVETEVVEDPGTDTPIEIEASASQLAAIEEERGWFRGVIKGGLIGLPIGAVAFVGIAAISLVGQGFEIKSMLVVAAIVGLNAGAFFGPWAAVVAHAHRVDESDQRAAHHE
jgi:NO-binding membrane sensor protein with MHYT domain